jgi:hypothetical protein
MKFYYLLLLFVITACGSGKETTTDENGENTQGEVIETVSDVTEPISEVAIGEADTDASDPDSLVVPSFAIHFDFSEKVQEILTSGKERLVIDLVLSGPAADKSTLMDKDYYSDEDELVYLKNVEIMYEQNEAQTFTIENLKVSKEALSALENPNYTIGVNFYSSRTSSDNNLFDASILIEELNAMKGKTHTVKIKML